MYNKILVPLDTSRLAEIVLPYAEELALKLGSEIILLHVKSPLVSPDKTDHQVYMDKMASEVGGDIKSPAASKKRGKISVKSVVQGPPSIMADPAESILDYAEKEKVSLIIMATHGRTGISRWTLGSTANKVARAARCSILLIRAAAAVPKKVNIEKILVPLDGSKPSEAVLPYVEALAPRLKSRISLLNVVEPLFHVYPYSEGVGFYGSAGVVRVPYTEEEMKPTKDVAEKYLIDVNDKLASKSIRSSYVLRTGAPGEEIIKAEEEMRPDMVAMSTHGHSGFGRWSHGSVADKVLHAGITPLLLVRPHKP